MRVAAPHLVWSKIPSGWCPGHERTVPVRPRWRTVRRLVKRPSLPRWAWRPHGSPRLRTLGPCGTDRTSVASGSLEASWAIHASLRSIGTAARTGRVNGRPGATRKASSWPWMALRRNSLTRSRSTRPETGSRKSGPTLSHADSFSGSSVTRGRKPCLTYRKAPRPPQARAAAAVSSAGRQRRGSASSRESNIARGRLTKSGVRVSSRSDGLTG